MNDTMQKYRDYVMTGFVKQVVPIVVEKASGAVVTDIDDVNTWIVLPEFRW